MPVTQGFAELPIYWGYVTPRLRALGLTRRMVIGLVGVVLSLQQMFFRRAEGMASPCAR